MRTTRKLALTIGIPTWNREGPMGALLSSISSQWRKDDRVEVIVADNASTDGTRQLVQGYRGLISSLHYIRQPRNVGLDENLRTLARAAKGGHLWIVGSDDMLKPGALSRVLDTLVACPGAMILGQRETMTHGHKSIRCEQFVRCPDYATFWLDEPGAVATYLSRATSVCAALTYLSSTVMPTAAWPFDDDEEWVGTYYTQTYAAWAAALAGVPLVVRQIPLVDTRVGNPGRRNGETAAHVLLDVTTFRRIASLQRTERDARAVREVLRHEYPRARLASLEERCHREPSWPFIRAALLHAMGKPL